MPQEAAEIASCPAPEHQREYHERLLGSLKAMVDQALKIRLSGLAGRHSSGHRPRCQVLGESVMREAQIGAFDHQQAGSREQLAETGNLRGFADVSGQV